MSLISSPGVTLPVWVDKVLSANVSVGLFDYRDEHFIVTSATEKVIAIDSDPVKAYQSAFKLKSGNFTHLLATASAHEKLAHGVPFTTGAYLIKRNLLLLGGYSVQRSLAAAAISEFNQLDAVFIDALNSKNSLEYCWEWLDLHPLLWSYKDSSLIVSGGVRELFISSRFSGSCTVSGGPISLDNPEVHPIVHSLSANGVGLSETIVDFAVNFKSAFNHWFDYAGV